MLFGTCFPTFWRKVPPSSSVLWPCWLTRISEGEGDMFLRIFGNKVATQRHGATRKTCFLYSHTVETLNSWFRNVNNTFFSLRRRSSASRLLKLWVRFPPGTWKSVSCKCWVLSGRGLCDELITRPEESYRLWCVVVGDLETSWMRRPWLALCSSAKRKKTIILFIWLFYLHHLLCFVDACWIFCKEMKDKALRNVCIPVSVNRHTRTLL